MGYSNVKHTLAELAFYFSSNFYSVFLYFYSPTFFLFCLYYFFVQLAGISVRDVYLFPCPKCDTAAGQQVNDTISFLQSQCVSNSFSGRVWLDIEDESLWLNDITQNQVSCVEGSCFL